MDIQYYDKISLESQRWEQCNLGKKEEKFPCKLLKILYGLGSWENKQKLRNSVSQMAHVPWKEEERGICRTFPHFQASRTWCAWGFRFQMMPREGGLGQNPQECSFLETHVTSAQRTVIPNSVSKSAPKPGPKPSVIKSFPLAPDQELLLPHSSLPSSPVLHRSSKGPEPWLSLDGLTAAGLAVALG